MTNKLYSVYKRFYMHGGNLPVYRGERFQYGSGMGETVQNIARFALPIAAAEARTFIKNYSKAKEDGRSVKDALKDAIIPTIADTLDKTAERMQQTGNGRRRGKRHGAKRSVRRGRKSGRVYKRQKKSGKRRRRRQTINFRTLKENF